jgi:hypothetical protein
VRLAARRKSGVVDVAGGVDTKTALGKGLRWDEVSRSVSYEGR